MTDSPLDGLLDDLETRASLYHSSGGPHRGHYRADLTNARAAILAEFATLEAELLEKQGYIDGFKSGVAQELAALRAEREGYEVQSVEWGHASTEVEIGTTRITVKGTVQPVCAGDTIVYCAAALTQGREG